MDLFDFIPGYSSNIYQTGREPILIMLLSFTITFIITRTYTRLAKVRGWGSASFGGVHAHHIVFGLIIAFLAGTLMFGFNPDQGPFLLLLAAAFGCGAALVLDEFALVFHLKDVYWEKEGRKSVDAIILGQVFGVILLLNVTPFGANGQESWYALTITILVNLSIVLIAALKGKTFMAIFGVFIPILAIIGAIRLAEPNSVWARKFYVKNKSKMKKSIQRYKEYEKNWRPKKEKLWDFIGGEIGRTSTKL